MRAIENFLYLLYVAFFEYQDPYPSEMLRTDNWINASVDGKGTSARKEAYELAARPVVESPMYQE